LQDGYHDLPAGKIACIVTYLEMLAAPRLPSIPPRGDLALRRLRGGDLALYLEIYRALGERWMWFSRLAMPQDRLRALLDDADVEAFALLHENRPAGLLELDFRAGNDGELVFFGLYETLIGTGAGRWLMNEALATAWRRPISRLFVHTCTFDHPAAVSFYRRSGFAPYKRAVEITDDPRLQAVMPETALPDIPLIR